MKLKIFGTLVLVLTIGIVLPSASRASGGIQAITGEDVGQSFNTRVEGGSYVVEGQGLKITIENGVVTVFKDKDTIKIDQAVEITGDIETRKIEAPINGIIDTGVTANGTSVTAPKTGVTAVPAGVRDTSFTGKFFRKIGIE